MEHRRETHSSFLGDVRGDLTEEVTLEIGILLADGSKSTASLGNVVQYFVCGMRSVEGGEE